MKHRPPDQFEKWARGRRAELDELRRQRKLFEQGKLISTTHDELASIDLEIAGIETVLRLRTAEQEAAYERMKNPPRQD